MHACKDHDIIIWSLVLYENVETKTFWVTAKRSGYSLSGWMSWGELHWGAHSLMLHSLGGQHSVGVYYWQSSNRLVVRQSLSFTCDDLGLEADEEQIDHPGKWLQ